MNFNNMHYCEHRKCWCRIRWAFSRKMACPVCRVFYRYSHRCNYRLCN